MPSGPSSPRPSARAGLQFLDSLAQAYRALTEPVVGRPEDVHPILGDAAPTTLGELFLACRHAADLDAIVYQGERLTYGELGRQVRTFAEFLRVDCHLQPGDRVAIAMRNLPEWVVAFWGAQVAGAVVVAVNAWSAPRELEMVARDARPQVVVTDAERLTGLSGWLAVNPTVRVVAARCADNGFAAVPFRDATAAIADVELAATPRHSDDVATILYTSGTTGRPRGVLGTQRNHLEALRLLHLRVAARRLLAPAAVTAPQSTALLTYPCFHISGISVLASSLLAGKRLVLMYRWNSDEAMRLIDEFGVSEVYSPPTVTGDLTSAARASGRDLPSLRALGGGGSASGAKVIADIREVFDGRVSPSTAYGLTETTGAVFANSGAGLEAFPASVGRPLPGIDIRIVDADGRCVRPDDTGELHVRGDVVARGYLDQPLATAAAFTEGWFRTGDLAYQDEHGLVYLVGRLKDLIIRGGENIHPAEVEEALQEHQLVVEAAVVGRPDERMGEEVTAVVRLAPDARLSVDELREFVARSVARHKVPTEVLFATGPLPRTATGKLQKQWLRDDFASIRSDVKE